MALCSRCGERQVEKSAWDSGQEEGSGSGQELGVSVSSSEEKGYYEAIVPGKLP